MTLCTSKCQLDRVSNTCVSCGRTIEEIVEWRDLDLAARAKIKKRKKRKDKMADKEYEFECPTCGSRFTIITSETDKPVHCPFCASALDDEEADDDYDWDEE